MAEDKRISELTAAGTLTGPELVEIVQGGINVKATAQSIANLAPPSGGTFEFGRAWSSELLFDKNSIYYADHTQTGAINFTIAAAGNLTDKDSVIRQRITSDGINEITFGSGFDFLNGISSGNVLPAGDYEIYFLYTNGSVSVSLPSNDNSGGITREFNRSWTETMVFDKNEIYFSPHIMSEDFDYVVGTGNLVNSPSAAIQTITADGIHALNFTSGFTYFYGAASNGVILPAGTYEIYFFYTNGTIRVNIPGVSEQSSGLTKLSTPGNFNVVADGENALDLSWDDVADEIEYQIEKSLTGTGGWVLLSNPAAGSTSDSDTGLNPGDVVYYRIKAVGDGVTHADSNYATASGMTEDTGDVTAPTFTFDPVNAATDWPVNKVITITANEQIRNATGSDLVNNEAGIITLKETNSGGADIPFTWSIDVSKTIITITPTTIYGASQVVYVAIDNVEDVSGNEITLQSITFTTTAFTFFNGTSNRIQFGDILDSIFSVPDVNFWLEVTIRNHALTGQRTLWAKADTVGNQRSFIWLTNGTDVYFYFYITLTGTNNRLIKWTNVLTSGEHDLVLKYDGSIDTNNGLDRPTLLIDGVIAGSKTLENGGSGLSNIVNSTSQLSMGCLVNNAGTPVGTYFFSGEAKDLIIRSTGGTVVEINVPVIADGEDVSGNNRDGTWV